MELQILHMIQGWQTDWLSDIMIFFTNLGNGGRFWILVSIILMIIPKTRKCGVAMALSMLLTLVLGNKILKNIVARPRPCAVDTSVILLIPYPGEYSFPSGHTSNAFAAAVSVFLFYRKPGIVAFIIAGIIAFSRMYLFVHYPTDILGGMILGTMDAMLVYYVVQKCSKRMKGRRLFDGTEV